MNSPNVSYFAKFPEATFEAIAMRAEQFNCKLPRLLQLGAQTRVYLEQYRDSDHDGPRYSRDQIGSVLLDNLFGTLRQYPESISDTKLAISRVALPEGTLRYLAERAYREGFPSFDHYLLGGHLMDMANHGENLLVAAG